MIKLKPCPICGGEARANGGNYSDPPNAHYVRCNKDPKCFVSPVVSSATAAAKLWNKLATDLAEVDKMREALKALLPWPKPEVGACHYCYEQSWYGPEHASSCPYSWAYDLLKKEKKNVAKSTGF